MSDPISDLKHELLAAAERQQGHALVNVDRRRRGRRGRNRLLLAAATMAIAAAVALLVTAPWNESPGFLAKARAALSKQPEVLHVKWVDTYTPTARGCTVTRSNEIWFDETPPYRYRGFLQSYPPSPDCSRGVTTEVGGTTDPLETFVFEPPNKLSAQAVPFNYLDLREFLRTAIDQGRAHDEGETQLDGRTVRRIRIQSPFPTYFYVDPETFNPVEIRAPALYEPGGGKVTKVADTVDKFLVYDDLPRTAANLALTNIHAQHPNATGP